MAESNSPNKEKLTTVAVDGLGNKYHVERNPVLSTPYEMPRRHWTIDDEVGQAINDLNLGRRDSSDHREHPGVGTPRKWKRKNKGAEGEAELGLRGGQLTPEQKRERERTIAKATHDRINELRETVQNWRSEKYPKTTNATRELLNYWADADRDGRPYWCQRDAAEALIWLLEAGPNHAPEYHAQVMRELRVIHEDSNNGLMRLATKMATGTGKTKTMQMMIAWRAVNHPRRARFLVVAPNLAVRDRLLELRPGHSNAYESVVPNHMRSRVAQAEVRVHNWHRFQPRKHRVSMDAETRKLTHGTRGQEPETEREMLQRVLGSDALRGDPWIVINDEAHHCYRPGEERMATEQTREERERPAIWFRTLCALQDMGVLEQILDFSATPMWITQAANRKRADIFPWVISNHPLTEAMECGLIKTPLLPVDDDMRRGALKHVDPKYRNLYDEAGEPSWARPREDGKPPKVPKLLEECLQTVYRRWEIEKKENPRHAEAGREPVTIMIVKDVATAKALYEHLAGRPDRRARRDAIKFCGSNFPLWRNYEEHSGVPLTQPPTLLVHSNIDNADAAEADNTVAAKAVAEAAAIHIPLELRAGSRKSKKALPYIRQILAQVGRPGTIGSHIRLVISINMLNEGWDAKNVTHIIGYRRFESSLLCEQAVGRGLRRADSVPGEDGRFPPETVEVYGIPFEGLVSLDGNGENGDPPPQPELTHVHAVEEREEYRMQLPRVLDYRVEHPQPKLQLNPAMVKEFHVSAEGGNETPLETEIGGRIGKRETVRTVGLGRRGIEFRIAQIVCEDYLESTEEGDGIAERNIERVRSALTAVRQFLNHPKVTWTERALRLEGNQVRVAEAVARACVNKDQPRRVIPILPVGDTDAETVVDTMDVDFHTTSKKFHEANTSHVNIAVCDSRPERTIAKLLDQHPLVEAWVRNAGLGFEVPYADPDTGRKVPYRPDFAVRLKAHRDSQPCTLIIEYKGQPKMADAVAKAHAMQEYWCPAVSGSDSPTCAGSYKFVQFTPRSKDLGRALDDAIRHALEEHHILMNSQL